MASTLSAYYDGFKEFRKKLAKSLDESEKSMLKYICFVLGLLFASCFPNFTKKCKSLFVIVGIIMMLPTIIKAISIFKDVFKYRWR